MSNINESKHIILYADDDADDLFFLQEAFERYSQHVEIRTALDGQEAIELLEALPEDLPPPCLIILDINMPRINGKEAFYRIRQMERFRETPVVFFSTSGMPADKDFAQRNNIGYMVKPLDIRQVMVMADQFIGYCTDDIKERLRRYNNSRS